MKKNLIFLIVDSVNYAQLMNQSFKHNETPFLNELKEKCVYTTNLYAQAPFTEAALTPLLSGIDLLDYGGYMKRFAYRQTLPEIFHNHGYETFINHYYACMYPSKTFLGIDKRYYVSFYDFSQVYERRLTYYKDFFLKDQLQPFEYTLLYDILEDNLKEWIHISEMLLAKDEQVELLLEYGDIEGIEQELTILRKEYTSYQRDPHAYLTQLYDQDTQHPLLQLRSRSLKNKVNKEFAQQVTLKFRHIFMEIDKLNRSRNLRNLPFPIVKIMKAAMKGNTHEAYQYIAMYKNAVFDRDIYERIDNDYGMFKDALSMKTSINHALKFLDTRTSEKPFCMYLHVDDAHSPENFFTSDSHDMEELKDEFASIQTYLNDLPKKFAGSLTSSLSLKYADSCIAYAFAELEKRGLLENTVVAITADHGFSYNYLPLRDTYVNNVYEENYHTPLFLYDVSLKPERNDYFYMAKDILPTLLDCCGIEIPKEITGESILKSKGRTYTLLEYMGGGCPDMLRREMILGCRSKKYYVVMKLHLHDVFEGSKITHVFNRILDPKEENNIVNKIKETDIAFEVNILKERFHKIQKNFEVQDHAFR